MKAGRVVSGIDFTDSTLSVAEEPVMRHFFTLMACWVALLRE